MTALDNKAESAAIEDNLAAIDRPLHTLVLNNVAENQGQSPRSGGGMPSSSDASARSTT
jgi:hypothetical protein